MLLKMYFKWRNLGEIMLAGVLVDAAIYVFLWLWNKRQPAHDDGDSSTCARCSGRITSATTGTDDVDDARYFYNVIFFPEEKLPCRFYYEGKKNGVSGCKKNNCEHSHNALLLEHLIKSLHMAQKSLDICVYIIACNELCNAIVNVHSRGVRVRVVTDGNFCDDSKSKIGILRAKGIPVRCSNTGFVMHHKFVVVDNRILVNGSFNWTWNAITANNENVLTTDNTAIVQPYVEEFARLWTMFEFVPSSNPMNNVWRN